MSDRHSPVPYWRLSNFYFFYFAALGALVPYWGLYLKHLNFNAVMIGELMAIIMGTKIIAPFVWGWIADHYGHRIRIIRIASVISVLAFAGVFFQQQFLWLALVMSVFSFFWNATLPQFEVATLNFLGKRTHDYTRIRLWGSIGFIISVAALGPMMGQYGASILPLVIFILMLGIWGASLLVPDDQKITHDIEDETFLRAFLKPRVIFLFIACLLMQMSHGPYYTFFSIYLEEHQYSHFSIGQLWALGVLAEVVLFFVMSRLLKHFSLYLLFINAFLLAALRWLLIAFYPDSLGIIIVAQILHAASFGLYHAVAILYIHQFFKGRHQGRGQALYSSISFGAGGAIGSLLGGYAWESLGGSTTFIASAVSAFAGLLFVVFGLRTASSNRDTR